MDMHRYSISSARRKTQDGYRRLCLDTNVSAMMVPIGSGYQIWHLFGRIGRGLKVIGQVSSGL